MIPPFTTDGVLPASTDASPYRCTRAEMEQRFVLDLHSPTWRRALYDGWDLLRASIVEISPSSRWWVWGTLITARAEPLFGDLALVDAAVIIPASELPNEPSRRALLAASVQSAQTLHRVDARVVYQFDISDKRRPATDAALKRWRSQGSRNIVNDGTREQIPAGFIEVLS